jgi:hypothetical protein
MAVTTRAAERCFQQPKFNFVKHDIDDHTFTLALSFVVFETDEVSASSSSKECDECIENFLSLLIQSVSVVIKRLDWQQKRVTSGISKDKNSFSSEHEIQLTSAIMFKQVLESIV